MRFPALLALAASLQAADLPQLNDPRFKLELVAEQPAIVTPTGMAVDKKGRLFVIESHTHQPKPDYPGPKTDRVKIFDGKSEPIIFAEGFRAAMNLAFDEHGVLHLVHRAGVLRLPDDDNDNKADKAIPLMVLETQERYPHNGLGGVAFHDGYLYLGFGENLGRAYMLHGSDSSFVKGGGEGGNIFRALADGSKVELFATGFWNPFALSFDSQGNLFAVDNDPDGRPPCRLLHVIRGGDYGYQFRYGRSGLHPFVAWEGEIPGTLGMVAGTGEAPSGMHWFPNENRFLVTAWGDNTLETYELNRSGASFKSEKHIFARGDASFWPVALAAAPDGSIYISDWADKEYAVHQKGRIWRLRGPAPKPVDDRAPRSIFNEIENTTEFTRLVQHATSEDPYIASAGITALAKKESSQILPLRLSEKANERLAGLLALKRQGLEDPAGILKRFLEDEDPRIRRVAMIWTAEKKIASLDPELLAAALREPTSPALVETYLAADDVLNGENENESVWAQGLTGKQLVARALRDGLKPPALKALIQKFQPSTNDVANGRKIFFSEKTQCSKCHRVNGEGGNVGPDLSKIAASNDRSKLLHSILEPSANIGPLYVTHEVATNSGDEYSGLLLERLPNSNLKLALADARVVEVKAADIASARTSNVSLMPDGLEATMSEAELRDLLTFLESLK